MKNTLWNRLFALLLCLCVLAGLVTPVGVMAKELPESEEASAQEELPAQEDVVDPFGESVPDPEEVAVELYDFEIVDKPVSRDLEVVTGKVFVPAYDGGTSSTWMDYDCGVGMGYRSTKNQSKLRIVTGTTSSGFTAWCTKLVDNGFTYVWHRSCPAQTNTNRYAKYLSPDGTYSIYTYFVPATKMTRIIVDTHEDTLGTFSYAGKGPGKTEVYMYYLSGMEDGWAAASPETAGTQFRSNAGSMFVIKMSDNSLFIVDGGGYNQMGDRACEELYDFLRSITGVPEGQRMTINTWFISHLHTDHCGGFPRFLQKFYTEFELCNVMYNFDIEGDSRGFVQRVSRIYPDAKYYKPHTGESFNVAGTRFDILYSVEDRYKPNSSNQLLLNDTSCTAHINENNTSIVMRMTFDGKTMLLTGDIRDADAVLMSMYPAADLKADILQIPHHNFDDHATLAQTVDPTYIFINQVKSSNFNRSRLYANRSGWRNVAEGYYFGGTETVGYSADKGVFYRETSDGYDYLGWAAGAYYIREENPVTVKNAATDPEKYYKYTRATSLSSSEKAYLIVDNRLETVLSYDAISGEITNSKTGLEVGDNFYFADSQRRLVNWYVKYGASGANSSALYADATHYTSVTIRKGSGSYWGTPTKNSGVTLGNGDTFTSTGFFGSRSPFSSQVEATSKQNWVDLLSDGTCLIYRYASDTVYPLFRDGDATGEGGWGTAKLSASTGTSRAAILLNRFYAYESTASTMSVSWSGHKDYYIYTGTSQDSVDTLLAADLRVKYTLDAFGATGEMKHTFGEEHRLNTYYLEYSPAYDNKTAQDYVVTIKYTSANGTAVTVGTTNLHVQSRPDAGQLYFDFNDDNTARAKYNYQTQYAGLSFDSATRWVATRFNSSTDEKVEVTTTVDKNYGTLKLGFKDSGTDKKSTVLSAYAAGYNPLKFSPGKSKVMQIRFRVINLTAAEGTSPTIRLWYTNTTEGTLEWKADRNYSLGNSLVSDGAYMVATVDLYSQTEIDENASVSSFPDTTFAKSGSVRGFRLGFYNLVTVDKSKTAYILIDYIYVGPKDQMPNGVYTVNFCQEDGTVLQNGKVYEGGTAKYSGTTPTKAYDENNHYTFSGWKNQDGTGATLTNISANKTFYAGFTASPHSYTYDPTDEVMHRGVCTVCGHSVEAEHSYTDGLCVCGREEVKEPVLDPALKLSHSLNLASDISINFVVPAYLLEGYDMSSVYVESTLENYEGETFLGAETVRMEPVEMGSYYYFTLTGITAVQMNDTVSSVLYGEKDGQPYYSNADLYSVAQYAYSQLDKANSTESLKTLCADLLRYGAKAQIYKEYRVSALADANMTEAHKAYLSDLDSVTFGSNSADLGDLADAPITWVGKTLDLDSKVCVKFVFDASNYTGTLADLSLKVTYKDIYGETMEVTVTEVTAYDPARNRYAFSVDALLASELREVLSVRIFAGETPVSSTFQYSPDTYGNNKSGTLLELCKALFAYSDSAKAYFSA